MRKYNFKLKATFMAAIFSACLNCAAKNSAADCSFIAIADAQYSSNAETKMNRHYKLSIQKLDKILESEKSGQFDFVVNLGDAIDGGFSNYKHVVSRLEAFPFPLYNLLGNHDLACSENEQLEAVKLLFKGGKTYYSMDKGGWKFIFLDPMRLSGVSKIKPLECKRQYEEIFSKLSEENAVNAKPWNGGIDSEQLEWLESQIKKAQLEKKKAIVFCHMPIFPLNSESLYNWREVSGLMSKYDCVKAYIAGHYHKGGYACADDIHYITVCGLVEGEKVSYARVYLYGDSIRVSGVGDVKSLDLSIR